MDTSSADDESAAPQRSHTLDDELATADRLKSLDSYERAWALPAEGKIRDELGRCWTAQSTHVNPFTDTVQGIEGLTRLILDFPAMIPGAAFRVGGPPDLHHDVARFAWQLRSTARIRMLGSDFGFLIEGLDYVEFDKQNKIRKVVAFYGPLASHTAGAAKAPAGHVAADIT